MKALLQLFEVTFQLVALLAELAEPIISIYNGMDIVTEARTTSPVYGWQCPALDNPPGGWWECSYQESILECSVACLQGFMLKKNVTLSCSNDQWVAIHGDVEDVGCIGLILSTKTSSTALLKNTTTTTTRITSTATIMTN